MAVDQKATPETCCPCDIDAFFGIRRERSTFLDAGSRAAVSTSFRLRSSSCNRSRRVSNSTSDIRPGGRLTLEGCCSAVAWRIHAKAVRPIPGTANQLLSQIWATSRTAGVRPANSRKMANFTRDGTVSRGNNSLSRISSPRIIPKTRIESKFNRGDGASRFGLI